MSQIKAHWIRMEQERAERAMASPAIGDLVKEQMDQLRATIRAKRAEAVNQLQGTYTSVPSSGPTSVAAGGSGIRVSDCIRDIALTTWITPKCPDCGQRGWVHFQLQNDPVCNGCLDVLDTYWKCSSCTVRNELRALLGLNVSSHLRLRGDIMRWLGGGLPQHRTPPLRATIQPPALSIYDIDISKYPKWKSHDATSKRGQEKTSETDKPIGTRDPDKFLKEQQNKLWEGVV